MPREIHSRFFVVLGVLLGALYGFIFSLWTPPRTATIADLYNPVIWAIAILSFFVLQYGLGVLLNKPNKSREIYFGVFLIPITYTISVLTFSIPNFLSIFVAVEIPTLVLFITSFYFVSPFVAFFAGFDTEALDEAKITAETVFSFDIRPSTEKEGKTLTLLTRIVRGMGLEISLKNTKDSTGLIICQNSKLHIGIFYEFNDEILTATFVPFEVVNDTVKPVEDLEIILDLKAQINGMLYAWMQDNLILRFNEIPPHLELGLERVSEGLGPVKTSITDHIKETIVSFPRNHPYQLAILTTGSVIIVNVMLLVLGKIVFKQ